MYKVVGEGSDTEDSATLQKESKIAKKKVYGKQIR